MANIYYNPDEFGYELVGTLDDDSLSYEFHMIGVWRRLSDGMLFWAEDSGCSCPSPFEDYTDPSGEWMVPIEKTVGEFRAAVRDFPAHVDKPRFLAMVAGSRFGVSTHVEGSTVTVYAT